MARVNRSYFLFDIGGIRSVVLASFVVLILFMVPGLAASEVSAPSPDFQLPYLEDDTKTLSLSDFRGQVLLLNLWASWCTGCRKEMSEFMALKQEYRQKKFSIVAVNLDDRKERALAFLTKFAKVEGRKVGFPTLYDPDKSLAARLNPTVFPASYLIDVRGNLVKTYNGPISGKDLPRLKQEIDALLKEAQ